MTEGLFILTTIFVAYVIYQVINDKKTSAKSATRDAEPAKKTETAPPPKPEPAVLKEAESAEPVITESIASAIPAQAAGKAGLRDPKTGDVATVFTNYRFTKRWIKDALVAEGLLSKVYKNNELDADAEVKIKAAMAKLEAMEKYRA